MTMHFVRFTTSGSVLRWLWVAGGALALSSCSKDSRGIDACEAILLPTLKAPASYHRVSDMVGPPQNGRRSVIITYDSVNSYNAPLRGTFLCAFKPSTGVATEDTSAQDEYADDLSLPIENAAEPIAEAKAPPSSGAASKPSPGSMSNGDDVEEEVPVCDRPDSPEKLALMNEIGTDCLGE